MNYLSGHWRDSAQDKLQARTAAHYDAYPFEFMTPRDEAEIAQLQPAPFRRFVDTYIRQGVRVAEIGCGPGRGTLYLVLGRVDLVAVDISRHSLLLARHRAPAGKFVLASNVALPFPDHSFDIAVSDGVVHHTPDPRLSFAENARIIKSGGYYYLGLYNRHRYYYYLYTFLGAPIRWLERMQLGRMLLFATVVPLYWFIHIVKSRGQRTWHGAVNFFYDYFITPRASFHTREEVCAWAREEDLELVEYDASLGNVHVFVFRKNDDNHVRKH
jgi:ubiquinone/menaquinone biosynthesis C-methylase UbiE